MSMHERLLDERGEPIDVGLLVDAEGTEGAQLRGRRNQVLFCVVLLLPFAALATGVHMNPLAAVLYKAEAVVPPAAAAITPDAALELAAAPASTPLQPQPNSAWRLVRERASPKKSSWSGGVIEGVDPEHPNGGCAPNQLKPDPVTACGHLCLKYRDSGCRFFYINIEGGVDRGFTIAKGRCCLKSGYEGEGHDAVGPGSSQYWWDKQEGTAVLNLYNAAFYAMVP